MTLSHRFQALVLCVLVMSAPLSAAGPQNPRPRLDALLCAATEASQPTTERVIVRVAPGARDAVRLAVTEAGDQAISGIGANTLVALVRSDRLAALAAREDVVSISSYARMGAQGGQPTRGRRSHPMQ